MDHLWLAWLLAPIATTLIAGLKGAFGGGFALLGIPLLALAMDPVEAGAMLAPLFLAMDVAAFRYWKPGTWSKPDLAVLLPGLAVGVVIGTAIVALLPRDGVALAMAVVTLAFAAKYFASQRAGQAPVAPRPRSARRGFWRARLPASRPCWRIPADRRSRCTCCPCNCPRPSMPAPPASTSPSPIC